MSFLIMLCSAAKSKKGPQKRKKGPKTDPELNENRPSTDLLLVKNGTMATKVKVSGNKHYKGMGFLNSPPPFLRNNSPKYKSPMETVF